MLYFMFIGIFSQQPSQISSGGLDIARIFGSPWFKLCVLTEKSAFLNLKNLAYLFLRMVVEQGCHFWLIEPWLFPVNVKNSENIVSF